MRLFRPTALLGTMTLLSALACRAESASPPRAPAEKAPAPAPTTSSAPSAASELPPEKPAPTPPPDLPPEAAYLSLSDGPSTDEKGCVRDTAKHAAEITLKANRAELAETLGHEPTLADFNVPKCISVGELEDLDGDGESESDVSICYTSGTATWSHHIYLSNRGCSKAAGYLHCAELLVVDSKRKVKDLESTSSNGCAGNDFAWDRFRFDGKTYRAIDRATCYFCDEKPPPGANRHPYCQKELSRRKREERAVSEKP